MSRECHSQRPQPTPDTKRKRKGTKINACKINNPALVQRAHGAHFLFKHVHISSRHMPEVKNSIMKMVENNTTTAWNVGGHTSPYTHKTCILASAFKTYRLNLFSFIVQQKRLSYQYLCHTCNVHPDMCREPDKKCSRGHIHFLDMLALVVGWSRLLAQNSASIAGQV